MGICMTLNTEAAITESQVRKMSFSYFEILDEKKYTLANLFLQEGDKRMTVSFPDASKVKMLARLKILVVYGDITICLKL